MYCRSNFKPQCKKVINKVSMFLPFLHFSSHHNPSFQEMKQKCHTVRNMGVFFRKHANMSWHIDGSKCRPCQVMLSHCLVRKQPGWASKLAVTCRFTLLFTVFCINVQRAKTCASLLAPSCPDINIIFANFTAFFQEHEKSRVLVVCSCTEAFNFVKAAVWLIDWWYVELDCSYSTSGSLVLR